jgi:hypothetical protein
MTSHQAGSTTLSEADRWPGTLDDIKTRRREIKSHAEPLDGPIRTILLNLQATLGLPGEIEPADVEKVCDPEAGLPASYIDYTNQRRNFDYWNTTAIWKLTHSSRGALYSRGGAANTSFTVTDYVTIALVMGDSEQPYINVHVYPPARLSVPNRARLAEMVQEQTGLPVRKCTHGDGCI